jgi:hypothetical protein
MRVVLDADFRASSPERQVLSIEAALAMVKQDFLMAGATGAFHRAWLAWRRYKRIRNIARGKYGLDIRTKFDGTEYRMEK